MNRYVEESYDLGLILGWYVAEGHISKRSGPDGAKTPNGIHFTIGTHELEYQQELAAAFKRVFAADLSVHQSVSDQSVRMVCNSKVVASLFLSMVGTGYRLEAIVPRGLNSRRGIPAWTIGRVVPRGRVLAPLAGWCSTW